MAWVLFKLNQPKEALDYILKAIQNAEEQDATVYDHLGDIYSALGQTDKAQEAWRKSISLEPNETIRRKLGPASK
jgi:tetratricopeptide (TPR) repeat protein